MRKIIANNFFLPILAGLILGAVFLFPQWPFLVFLAPAIIIVYLLKIPKTASQASFGLGLAHFVFALIVLWYLKPNPQAQLFIIEQIKISDPQLVPIFPFALFFLWLGMGLWVSLPFALAGFLFWELRRGDSLDLFLLAPLWTLAEFFRVKIFFGISWANLGYWFFNIFPNIGLSVRSLGVLGLTFLVMLIAGGLAGFFFFRREIWKPTLVIFLIFFLLEIAGRIVVAKEMPNLQENSRPAFALQGYLPWGQWQMDGLPLPKNYLRLLNSINNPKRGIIVLPEEILDPLIEASSFLENLRSALGADLLIFGQARETTTGLLNNFYILDNSQKPKEYTKHFLLPFGERIPSWAIAFKKFFPTGEYLPGPPPSAIETPSGWLGVFSCVELLVPAVVNKQIASGAEIFISGGSEIAWDRPVWEQSLLVARVQSASFDRYLIRAMKRGYSAIVDPFGRIATKSDGLNDILLEGRVSLRKTKTIYAQTGDGLIFTISSLLLLFFERKKRDAGQA